MAASLSVTALWQAWRWGGFAVSLTTRGSAFLPRAVTCRPETVERILDRRRLFADAGTRRLRGLAGRTVAGDWDRAAAAAAEHPALLAFERRFVAGSTWEDTAYWQDIVADVARGRRRIGCGSVEEVERKFQSFDRLWQVLGTAAYRRGGGPGPYRPWEEILLAINRRGELLLVDGRHRLLLARVKRCPFPAVVVLRHATAPREAAQTGR